MKETVLLVEDNAVTRRRMRVLLEREGFMVVEACDGKAALERAADTRPAIIVQDIRLPDIDGFELVERLRGFSHLAQIPILAVTGLQPDDTSQMQSFTQVLTKPVDSTRLVFSIKALLARLDTVGPAHGRRRALLAEDDLVQRKILRLHLQQWGFDATEAANGFEGLRIARASRPDVIVSDLLMPEMDGLRFCREVRGDPDIGATPFVLVTSYHLDEVDRDLAASAGASAIVPRSREMVELQRAVATITRHEASPPLVRTRSRDISKLVVQVQRDASARENLEQTRVAHAALLPFFARFAELEADDAADVDVTVGELLGGYLDAQGAACGCAYLATPAGLKLASQLGYPAASASQLREFFGRGDLLEEALAAGASIQLPSSQHDAASISDLLARADAVSMILAPLIIGSERLGVFALSSRSPPSSDRLSTADAVRGPIAQALALGRRMSELVSSRRAFHGVVDSSFDGIVVSDAAGTITYANPAALEMFGYVGAELVDHSVAAILRLVDGTGERRAGVALRKDGTSFSTAVTVTSFQDKPGRLLHAYVIRDLSQRETLDRLAALANRDGLTGLYNRRRFDEHVASRLAETIRYGSTGALLIVDLDGFKVINDTFGHHAGDVVLKAVADILSAETRSSDFVARLGGDEFAIDLQHIQLADAVTVANKLIAAIAVPIRWRSHQLQVGASVGLAMYPEHGDSLERVLEAADGALYQSKRAGRNRVTAVGSR